ncbi:MAG: mobile mystery protein B [Acidimicrobiia bacterium]
MTDFLLPSGDGHTELSDEDRVGLLPTYIATRGELFDAEQRNIAEGLFNKRPSRAQLLDDKYLRDLHRSMFGNVWRWAGRYRTREPNIGIDPRQIAVAVRDLVADTNAWVDHHSFEVDELCARFHHRLVEIHPFPNGNGRHGRIATDLLLSCLGSVPFSWGIHLAVDTTSLRRLYVGALQRADSGDITALLEFARS